MRAQIQKNHCLNLKGAARDLERSFGNGGTRLSNLRLFRRNLTIFASGLRCMLPSQCSNNYFYAALPLLMHLALEKSLDARPLTTL